MSKLQVSNQLDSRNASGFYTLLEDEMFGKGLTNIGEHNTKCKKSVIIRSFGSIWYNFETEGQTVRMYLYEFRNAKPCNLSHIDRCLKQQLTSDKVNAFLPPNIQHSFAEDDGTIRDTVKMWTNVTEPLFYLDENLECIKLAKVTHLFQGTKTAFDFHVRIQARAN